MVWKYNSVKLFQQALFHGFTYVTIISVNIIRSWNAINGCQAYTRMVN